MREPVLMSWSGGKDSAMALHQLRESDRYEVVSLLTTVAEDQRRISHHGVRESLLDAQAEAIGIPLQKVYLPSGDGCSNDVYAALMKEAMLAHLAEGISTVAFGDLFLQDLRDWREANLARVGMRALFPVWQRDSAQFANEVIARGFKARLSSVQCRLGPQLAGRFYDADLLNELPAGVDLCGENGEFHTFVYDGPIFRHPIEVRVNEIIEGDGNYVADLETPGNAPSSPRRPRATAATLGSRPGPASAP